VDKFTKPNFFRTLLGSFVVDMWRMVIYIFLPAAFALSIVFLIQSMPMTFQSDYQVNTLEPAAMGTDSNNQPKQQTIVVGPLAAFVPMKMLGTNGGGFFGMNSAHPFENPTAGSNIFTTRPLCCSRWPCSNVRPDAQPAPPFGCDLRRDADAVGRHRPLVDLLRHSQTQSRF
jgi:K+-transporting ATPase A subunit